MKSVPLVSLCKFFKVLRLLDVQSLATEFVSLIQNNTSKDSPRDDSAS